ncbi:MAG: radical SAM protein [Deltaproteobacteria bacterium HGW-Deltaproteobacteria-4]|nr:MAG: radical SAM protein [Deltaproteobacteria bacterium HGW-Deltaproteobacteria-4]
MNRPAQLALIDQNRQEYGDRYAGLSFPSASAADSARVRRSALLADLEGRATLSANASKLESLKLSPGCRACLEGNWSCLFITGNCNCRCFYCPTAQDVGGAPGTNNLDFPKTDDYVDYLARFGFTGASISGGEPLLVLEKSLQYLRAIRRRLGDGVHLWLYTNGTLLTRDIARRLRDAGLDEIRVDIGATDYALDQLKLAVGIIPHITVEIPAIPEEGDRLQEKLVEMADSGVNYLNLHQLRLTNHNYPQLAGRGYTYLHGESVTVLESELTALELLRYSLDHSLSLGVNYCSFVYKNRFQGSAGRRRAGAQIVKKYEEITAAGYLRSLSLSGPGAEVQRQVERLQRLDPAGQKWLLAPNGTELHLASSLWSGQDDSGLELKLRYAEARILPAISYRNAFIEVPLNPKRKVAVERQAVSGEWRLGGAEWRQLQEEIAGSGTFPASGSSPLQQEMRRFEQLPVGLQDYF